jgi:hypothetical protein
MPAFSAIARDVVLVAELQNGGAEPQMSPQPVRRSDRERAREILSYFVRNPQAADSFEGVVRWRLLEEAVHRTVDETRRGLEWLVAAGFLVESTSPGAGPIFRLNPERAAAAARLVSRDARADGEQV